MFRDEWRGTREMRKVTKILIGFVLSLFLCVSSFAQNKIAMVHTDAFESEKTGIKKLTNAVRMIGFLDFTESFRASDLRHEIEILEKEIATLSRQKQEIIKKYEQLLKLKDQLKVSEEKVEKLYEEWISENIAPIRKRINEKLKEFSKQKGYALVFEKRSIDDGVIIIDSETDDITNEFIKFCNEEFEKEKTAK